MHERRKWCDFRSPGLPRYPSRSNRCRKQAHQNLHEAFWVLPYSLDLARFPFHPHRHLACKELAIDSNNFSWLESFSLAPLPSCQPPNLCQFSMDHQLVFSPQSNCFHPPLLDSWLSRRLSPHRPFRFWRCDGLSRADRWTATGSWSRFCSLGRRCRQGGFE